jgi:cyanophycinase
LYPSLLARQTGVDAMRLVHCPLASPYWHPRASFHGKALHKELEAYFHEWVALRNTKEIADLQFLILNRTMDCDQSEILAMLQKANAFWFSGGDQTLLAELFTASPEEPTKFQQAVCDIVSRGGLVGGSSAGLAIMSGKMICSGTSGDGKPERPVEGFGLGILKNVIAEQHFDKRAGRIERFITMLRQVSRRKTSQRAPGPLPQIGMAVEEETWMVLEGNTIKVFGKNEAHVFLVGRRKAAITWHALSHGDTARVLIDPQVGHVLKITRAGEAPSELPVGR